MPFGGLVLVGFFARLIANSERINASSTHITTVFGGGLICAWAGGDIPTVSKPNRGCRCCFRPKIARIDERPK